MGVGWGGGMEGERVEGTERERERERERFNEADGRAVIHART